MPDQKRHPFFEALIPADHFADFLELDDYQLRRNAHDAYLRYLFSERSRAIEFFGRNLSLELLETLDLPSIRLASGSFVDPQFRSTQSDLLFTISARAGGPLQCYLLFEHKSYVDRSLLLQLLGYDDELSIFGRFIPEFDLQLYNLAEDNLDHYCSDLGLDLILLSLRHSRDESLEFFSELALRARHRSGENYLEILRGIFYYLSIVRRDSYQSLVHHFLSHESTKEAGMSAAKELLRQGLEQGLEQGAKRRAIETAQRMAAEGFSLDTIIRISALSEEELRLYGVIEGK